MLAQTVQTTLDRAMDSGPSSPAPPPEAQLPDTQADVFVSYARADEAKAIALIGVLKDAGFAVWWDGMLEPGSRYTNRIEEALDQAKAVVVLWSASSVESNWVRDEAESGRDRSSLVPVSLDGCLPPLGFRQFQAVDMTHWKGKASEPGAQAVLNAVRHLVSGEALPDMPRPLMARAAPAPSASRRTMGLAALVAVVAVALAGLFIWGGFGRQAEVNSLAILPFENVGEAEDEAYFASGLGEEVRQVLSQSEEIRLAAQSSTETAATGDASAQQIATQLGVRYLLDGSVRRVDGRVRVSVQLIDGAEGFDVWSQTYDRDLDDIFAVQLDIAQHVADALEVRIGAEDGPATRVGGTASTVAYDAFLRGQSLYDLALNEESDRNALAQLKAAVETDPNYGAAWAALSTAQTTIANIYPSDRPRMELYDEAIASANRAIAVAPRLADGHAALGYVLLNGRLDARGAEEPYRKAYALAQNDSGTLQAYASFMARTGDFAAAREAIDRAITLDPLNAILFRLKGQILALEGSHDEAREVLGEALALNPDMSVAHRVLGDMAYLEGDYAKAIGFYEKEPSSLSRLTGLATAYAKAGRKDEAEASFAELKREHGDNGLYQQAMVLAQTGRLDQAMDALEEAFTVGDSGLVLARNEPMLVPLRANPRFQALLRRMGFTLPDAG